MNIKFILLILLICIYSIKCAKEHSDKVHTQTYYEWKSGDFTKTLYLEDTFIENGDICRQMDRQSYIKYLVDLVPEHIWKRKLKRYYIKLVHCKHLPM